MRPAVVYSNSVAVPFTDALFAPLPDSSALLDDPAALRRRFRRDGVLRLRGVLDPEQVLGLRRAYLATLPAGVIASATPLEEGIFSGHVPADLPAHGVRGHGAYAFVRSAVFREFVDSPALVRLATLLHDGPVVRLPRAILRHFYAGSGRASRAHTDYAYMDRGTERLLTMWVPVGRCPIESGPLVHLEDSHTIPRSALDPVRRRTDRPEDTRPLSHDLRWTAETLGRRWLWADYAPGDVVVHDPHTVHASLDTVSRRMRVSVDVRFARAGAALDPRWTRPWRGDDGA